MPQTIHRGIKALIDEANAEIETVSATDAIKQRKATTRDRRSCDPREIERDGRIPGRFLHPGMLNSGSIRRAPTRADFQATRSHLSFCAGDAFGAGGKKPRRTWG